MTNYTIKRILVPIDLSDTSLNALNIAIKIAKINRSFVQVMNVIEPSFSIEDDTDTQSAYRRRNFDVITALIGSIHRATGVKPELLQMEGLVLDTIMTTATNGAFNLIVIGTHGASGFREGYIGNTAYGVIKYARCPVLTVPGQHKNAGFSKVLFPIRPVAGALKRINIVRHFLSGEVTIDVLGFSSSNEEQVNGIMGKLIDEISPEIISDNYKLNGHWTDNNSIIEDILDFSQKNNSDLIVLTSGLDAISKANYIGPYAQKLLNLSKKSVLSVKYPGLPLFI